MRSGKAIDKVWDIYGLKISSGGTSAHISVPQSDHRVKWEKVSYNAAVLLEFYIFDIIMGIRVNNKYPRVKIIFNK